MIKIASIPANIKEIEGYIDQIFSEYRLDRKIYPNVLISLTEAVNNAMIHGNRLDEKKYVCLTTILKKHKLCFKISDEGPGFNPTEIKDPTCAERIEECGGRGVLIMKELSDQLTYHNNGSTVEIHFQV